jgi:hypothetical protein
MVQLAETTDGPEQLNDVDAAPSRAVDALLNVVMERIAAAIKTTDFSARDG